VKHTPTLSDQEEKHPDWDRVFSATPEFMAKSLGNLKYDQLQEFLRLLAQKLKDDSLKDAKRGRIKLATELNQAATHICAATEHIGKAWLVCKPYMGDAPSNMTQPLHIDKEIS